MSPVGDRESRGANGDARIVVANGQDLDKRYFYEVTKRMARDRDLRRLSLLGPLIWATLSLLVGLGLARISFRLATSSSLVYAYEDVSGTSLTLLADALAAAVALIVVLLVVTPSIELLSRDAVSALKRAASHVTNAVFVLQPEVRQNLNYWHPFTSNLSDRDPLVPLAVGDTHPVSGIYSDAPHYRNVFVDSVYLQFDGDLTWRHRLLATLYGGGRGRSVLRQGVLILSLLPVSLWIVNRVYVRNVLPFPDTILWLWLAVIGGGVATPLLLACWASGVPGLRFRYYALSAGLSRYNLLLNEPEEVVSPTGYRERRSLANSMNGYGLLYLSKFIREVLGNHRFDIDADPTHLSPASEGGDGADGATSFPARGFDPQPSHEHATAGAAELLWSAIPPDSVRRRGEEADVTVRINGVEYHTVESTGRGWIRNRLPDFGWLSDPGTQDELVSSVAGDASGVRVPVKRFMSVRHDLERQAVEGPIDPPGLLYFDDSWEESEVHTVFLGGGEHQQAINKLLLAMKADGLRNVDVLENAFSTETEGEHDQALFPTEYFVSFVGGDSQAFRQDNEGFLLLKYELDGGGDQTRWCHVLIGMSAVGTKVGFLYWLDAFEEGSKTIEENVVHFFRHPGPTGFESDEFDDIGDLYTNTEWREGDGLTFSISEVNDATLGGEEPTDATLGLRYYDLDIVDG